MEPIVQRPVTIDRRLAPGDERTLAEDVLDGLTRPFKELPPKHFYDARGAELFDRICNLPEYYPTRTERSILQARAAEIVDMTDAAEIVELGSGTAAKTRVLLSAMERAGTLWRYVPFDVAEQVVRDCAAALADEYPDLSLHGIVGDFERHLPMIPPPVAERPRVVAFLGGTIGNFPPGARRRFLRALARLLTPGDYLLLGTDLVKDIDVLEAAYDDAQGVTAEFNRNVLHVINQELGGDFDPEAFEHVARWDAAGSYIEMRLRSLRNQQVRVADLDLEVDFAAGEEMQTEISTKFTPDGIREELWDCGFVVERSWTDPAGDFLLTLSHPYC